MTSIEFCGPLSDEDYTVDRDKTGTSPDLVTVHREGWTFERRLDPALFADIQGIIAEFDPAASAEGLFSSVFSGKTGDAERSARYFTIVTVPYEPKYAGKGVGYVCVDAPNRGLPAYLHQQDLEVWALPVVESTFQVLVTPKVWESPEVKAESKVADEPAEGEPWKTVK